MIGQGFGVWGYTSGPVMAMAVVVGVPEKSPACSGDDLRRRRVDYGDPDGTTEAMAWSTKLGVDGDDDGDRPESR